jgi:TolB-like protein
MHVGMIDRQAIRRRWEAVGSKLDERGRRMFAAGEALVAGWGGLETVSEITGLARSTIGRGKKELNAAPLPKGRIRRNGAGRPDLSSRDATLVEDLRSVIEPATLGDPVRPMLCVSKSHEKLAVALQKMGHEISASSVKRLLSTLGYSRQSNRKAEEGSKHPDRNAQFEHINTKAIAAQAAGQPVISVDTKNYFADGITENLTTDLSRIRSSFVIARNTAFSFKGKNVSARQISSELGVRYVLEGSVQRDQSRVRVNAQLIDGSTGAHIWAERLEQDIADVFKLQDQAVARLANTVGDELVKAEAQESLRSGNPDLIDLDMRGWATLAQ